MHSIYFRGEECAPFLFFFLLCDGDNLLVALRQIETGVFHIALISLHFLFCFQRRSIHGQES